MQLLPKLNKKQVGKSNRAPCSYEYENSLVCQGAKLNNLCSQIRPTTEPTDNGMLRCNYHKSCPLPSLQPLLYVHPTPPMTSIYLSKKNPHLFSVPFASNSSIVSCTFAAPWGAGIPEFKCI